MLSEAGRGGVFIHTNTQDTAPEALENYAATSIGAGGTGGAAADTLGAGAAGAGAAGAAPFGEYTIFHRSAASTSSSGSALGGPGKNGSTQMRTAPSSMPVKMRPMIEEEHPMYGFVLTSMSHTLNSASTMKSKPNTSKVCLSLIGFSFWTRQKAALPSPCTYVLCGGEYRTHVLLNLRHDVATGVEVRHVRKLTAHGLSEVIKRHVVALLKLPDVLLVLLHCVVREVDRAVRDVRVIIGRRRGPQVRVLEHVHILPIALSRTHPVVRTIFGSHITSVRMSNFRLLSSSGFSMYFCTTH